LTVSVAEDVEAIGGRDFFSSRIRNRLTRLRETEVIVAVVERLRERKRSLNPRSLRVPKLTSHNAPACRYYIGWY